MKKNLAVKTHIPMKVRQIGFGMKKSRILIKTFKTNIQNELSEKKLTVRFNDCLQGKTSLAKNLQINFRGGVRGVTFPVSRPVFHR